MRKNRRMKKRNRLFRRWRKKKKNNGATTLKDIIDQGMRQRERNRGY